MLGTILHPEDDMVDFHHKTHQQVWFFMRANVQQSAMNKIQ